MTTFDLATAIEALRIAEDKTREVRQRLEAQLRKQREAEALRNGTIIQRFILNAR